MSKILFLALKNVHIYSNNIKYILFALLRNLLWRLKRIRAALFWVIKLQAATSATVLLQNTRENENNRRTVCVFFFAARTAQISRWECERITIARDVTRNRRRVYRRSLMRFACVRARAEKSGVFDDKADLFAVPAFYFENLHALLFSFFFRQSRTTEEKTQDIINRRRVCEISVLRVSPPLGIATFTERRKNIVRNIT